MRWCSMAILLLTWGCDGSQSEIDDDFMIIVDDTDAPVDTDTRP